MIHFEMARFLLERGADPNIGHRSWEESRWQSRETGLLLETAVLRKESYSIIWLLLQYGADAKLASCAFFEAVKMEKVDEFKLLVDNGANLFLYYGPHGLLRVAYVQKCPGIGEIILGRGVTIEQWKRARPARPFHKREKKIIPEGPLPLLD